MVRVVAVPRGWVVCAAKQGQQQHRELQRTVQRTWSPTERYSASRVVPVTRRHSEGVRCSGVEHFFVRGHRIAPFARGRPSLEKHERAPRRPSKARVEIESREMGVQRGTLAMRATRKYDNMAMPVPNGVQLQRPSGWPRSYAAAGRADGRAVAKERTHTEVRGPSIPQGVARATAAPNGHPSVSESDRNSPNGI